MGIASHPLRACLIPEQMVKSFKGASGLGKLKAAMGELLLAAGPMPQPVPEQGGGGGVQGGASSSAAAAAAAVGTRSAVTPVIPSAKARGDAAASGGTTKAGAGEGPAPSGVVAAAPGVWDPPTGEISCQDH